MLSKLVIVRLWLAAFLITPTFTLSGQATPGEQATIRRAYAKSNFAVDMGSLILNTLPSRTAAQNDDALTQGRVTFNVDTVEGGPFSEVAGKALKDTITIPTETVLSIHLTGVSYTEQSIKPVDVRSQSVAHATWDKAAVERLGDLFNMSVSEAVSRARFGNIPRYAIATITVGFQGVSKSYRALFLFRSDQDFEAFDLISDGVGLMRTLPLYPHVILETRRRFEPAFQQWVASHQVADCTPSSDTVCCDPKTMTCGISAEDAAASLAQLQQLLRQIGPLPSSAAAPLPTLNELTHNYGDLCSDFNSSSESSPQYNTTSDQTQHVTGAHTFSTASYGTCQYFNAATYPTTHQCGSTATAYVKVGIGDNGVTYPPLYFHVTGASEGYGSAMSFGGPGGATVTATGAAAVRSCLGGTCSVTISGNVPGGGSISFPSDAIWTQTVPNTISCGVPITNFLQPTYPYPGDPTDSPCALYPTLPECLNPR